MVNSIEVFSKTSQRWIRPQSYTNLWHPMIRKREGEEAIIFVDGVCAHVTVEKSTNGYWWLVEKQ